MGNVSGGSNGLHPSIKGDAEVFDACGIPLAEVTRDGRVLRLNSRMQSLLEVEAEGAPAALCDLLPSHAATTFMQSMARALEGTAVESDGEFVLKSGSHVPVRLSIAPFPAKQPRSGLVAAVPLEPYREAARAAEKRVMEARRMESLGMLAGGIAHDFNNLLVGIVGGACLIETDIPPDSPARKHLRLITETAQRVAALTQQMLAFSGHGHVTMEGLDLSTLIDEERDSLNAIVRERGCRLVFNLKDNLPLVEGDRFQLRKALRALVSNACEAMQGANGNIEVRTQLIPMRQQQLSRLLPPEPRTEGDYVLLEVSDQGPGVPDQLRDKVFDPFFTTHESGRGLGLAATLGIMRGHRGFIDVETAPGGGALFRLGFPARTEGRQSAVIEDIIADETTPGTGMILIVDDEEMVRHVTGTILRRAGYEIIEARDGIEAIEQVDANYARVSLVLLDLSMPRMGGREAMEEIRARHPHLPVLLMSGYPEAEACVGFRRRDLSGFLQKPFRAEQLREAVASIVPGLVE